MCVYIYICIYMYAYTCIYIYIYIEREREIDRERERHTNYNVHNVTYDITNISSNMIRYRASQRRPTGDVGRLASASGDYSIVWYSIV